MSILSTFFAAANSCASSGNPNGIISPVNIPQNCANQNTIHTLFLIAFAIIGSLVLLFFVIAGTRYTLSKGEPENIQKAKNEMKFALIGLIIVALAASIVNFVLNKL